MQAVLTIYRSDLQNRNIVLLVAFWISLFAASFVLDPHRPLGQKLISITRAASLPLSPHYLPAVWSLLSPLTLADGTDAGATAAGAPDDDMTTGPDGGRRQCQVTSHFYPGPGAWRVHRRRE